MILHSVKSLLSRCIEEGDCQIWQGATDGYGRAQTRHDGRIWYVRRLMFELTAGRPIKPGLVMACKCGNPRCVSMICAVETTNKGRARLAVARDAYRNADKIRRMTVTRRANSKFSDELVEQIRNMDESCAKISKAVGMSLSHVKAIRRGTIRIDYKTNPFANFMASNANQGRASA
jgi:hypothetical protein